MGGMIRIPLTYSVEPEPDHPSGRPGYAVVQHDPGCPDEVVFRARSRSRCDREAARLRATVRAGRIPRV